MTHMAPPAAQEESNALTNEVALERAWFSVARGAMAHTDMLERFENLLADYDSLAETHAECSEMVWKLVDARLDLEHNAKLYMDVINRLRAVKEEHAAARIQSLESELAKKDSTLTYTERLLVKGVKDHDKLTIQLGQAKGKGLSEGCTDKEILDLVHKAKDFDLYYDRKLYPMYDKLEAEYLFIEKVASGYHHSVAELLRVHPDPAPAEGTSAPTISKALGGSSVVPLKGN
ncbi:hypothetical protein Tco_0114902 [Tanacetum coccineum]